MLRRRRTPDLIQALFEFGKDAGGGDQQNNPGNHACKPPGNRIPGRGQQRLDRPGTVGAHCFRKLGDDFALSCLGAEEIPGHRDGQHQDGGHGKQGVKGQGRALAGAAMVEPGL